MWEGPISPSSADQPWPVGRGVHATACLVDPESELAFSHQEIAVFWGDGKDAIHLSDSWILHVQNKTWKQVATVAKCSREASSLAALTAYGA